MTGFTNWLDTFLEEKGWTPSSWEIKGVEGLTHFIDGEVVVEAIKGAPGGEQRQIKETLVKIDFLNGDIDHFFQHLARSLVDQRQ